MMDVVILLAIFVPALTVATQTSSYVRPRDYLSITSENYPDNYPAPDSWTWQWAVDSGLWAVVFVDFQLDCGHHDRLVISDPRRNLTFTCGNRPPKDYAYFMEGPRFTMRLFSTADNVDLQSPRRFECQVLYGTSRGELQSKIDGMRTKGDNNASNDNDDSGPLPSDMVIVLLLLVIVPLVVVVVVGAVVVMLRRRQLQQSTNTSVHLNIGAIRRDSSVSYTRHGNGPPPGARGRLDSTGSLSQDPARPKRSVKRSESNASWAMRAEMNTAFRSGSCSSEGRGNPLTTSNLYTPYPGEHSIPFPEEEEEMEELSMGYKGVHRALPGVCRLSTICEESSRVSKLNTSFPVPEAQAQQPSLAIDNAGYMLMTACSTNYANCGQD